MWNHLFKVAIGLVTISLVKSELNHTGYHSHAETLMNLADLIKRFPNNSMGYTLERKTFEGRSVPLVRLFHRNESLSNEEKNIPKRTILIEAGQHGNEWLAPAATMYFIERVLMEFEEENGYEWMLEEYDWLIMPMVNPDGYEFSRSAPENRCWRKNRRRFDGLDCIGVDINQNYMSYYISIDKEFHDCGYPEYEGPNNFSENETNNTVSVFLYHKSHTVAYVNIKGHGQDIAVPPMSYTREQLTHLENIGFLHNILPRVDERLRVANIMRDSIKNFTALDALDFDVGLGSELPISRAKPWSTAAEYMISAKRNLYAYELSLGTESCDERQFQVPESEILSEGDILFGAMVGLAKGIDPDFETYDL